MRVLFNRVLLALALGHFVIDFNANLIPVMLPFLRQSIGLSYTQAGLIIASYSAFSSLAQPLFGYLSDKIGGRWLLVLPILWTVLLMGLSGLATSFPMLLVLVVCSGLGSAAYHPQGAANARRSGGRNVATAVSIFSLAGIGGFALGPLVGAQVFTQLNLKGTVVFIIPGIIAVLTMLLALRGAGSRILPTVRVATSAVAGPSWKSIPFLTLGALLFVVVSRSWVESSVVTYTPLRFEGEIIRSSQLLFVFLFSEAIGTFIGALLADRFSRRLVIIGSCFAVAPAIYLFNTVDGPLLFAVAMLSGMLIGSAIPVTIVMAQELLPGNVGVASGLMMGFAFGLAGIGVTINGVIADNYGLATSLLLISILPVIGGLVALTLPKSLEARHRMDLVAADSPTSTGAAG